MNNNEVKCPKCSCTQIHSDKKGFSAGKAVAGTLVGGVLVGAAAGGIGKDKIVLTCLKCGHQFKIGDKPKTAEQKKSEEDAQNTVGKIMLFLAVIFLVFTIFKCCI